MTMVSFKATSDLIKEWTQGQFPCSFRYDERDSDAFLNGWKKEIEISSSVVEGNPVTEYGIVYRDPSTRLACKITARTFPDFPAIDWVIEFTNGGTSNTPIIEAVHAIEWVWETMQGATPVLHYAKGSDCKIDDFLPQSQTLVHWKPVTLSGVAGRPSVTTLPFFCIQQPANCVFLGIGWSGQWAANIALHQPTPRDNSEVGIDAGMERVHLRLHPGETIRTPRVLLFFHDGDRLDGHNRWRRLLLKYFSPYLSRPAPSAAEPAPRELATVPLAYPMWGGVPEQGHIDRVKMIVDQRLAYEYYWIDAAWFIDESETEYEEATGSWARHVGRWRPNKNLYPRGLKPVADAVHAAGMKFLIWVEPERGRGGAEWPRQHPEFYLGRHGGGPPFAAHEDVLFNLGLPEARKFLLDFLTGFIKDVGIDCYRQDFNIDPLPYWLAHDAPDRQGMTEIQHVMGLYQLWDDLRARFPGLIIDNCASGGRRIDIETIQRSIPLWRSDFQCFYLADPIGAQVATAGLMLWAPLSSTGTQFHQDDDYAVRSAYSSGLVFHHGTPVITKEGMVFTSEFNPKGYPWDWHRRRVDEFRKIRPFFEGDYYLLSNCTSSTYDWLVYQCDRPDMKQGIVLAFRRQDSPYVQARLKLHGIDATKRYSIENSDTGQVSEVSGDELASRGLLVAVDQPRSSSLYIYRPIS